MDQQQLSGIDASFLYLETPETPMHVAGLTYFQLPEGFEGSFYRHFRSFFESRLHTIPIFSKRLAPSLYDLDHPGWVDADDLDLDYHLRETALPAPGTEAQLEEVIGRLHANTLDRSRPLWQFYVITGLENGQGVLYSKVHHAAIDGGAGMAINKALYDVTAMPREVAPPPPKPAAPKPAPSSPTAVDPVKGIADIMGNMMRQQLKMWEAAPAIMNAMTDAFLAKPGEMPKALGTLQSLVSPAADAECAQNAVQRHHHARAQLCRAHDLARRRQGDRQGKRRQAQRRGDGGVQRRAAPLSPGKRPVARQAADRRRADKPARARRHAAEQPGLGHALPDRHRHRRSRRSGLRAIVRSSSQAKQLAGTFRDAVPQDFAFVGAPILLQLVMLVYGRSGLADRLPMPMNVTISNVPGPPMPLYCAGAKVTALHPVSIAAHGAALNITVQSYMDALNFGLTADRRAVPDVGRLGDYLVEAADELKKAVAAG